MTKLRHSLPKDTLISLRAPLGALKSEKGPLRPTAAQSELLQWTLEAAEKLQVRLVLLPTTADLMPGARSRKLLADFVAALPSVEGRDYVWAPRGAWDADEIAAVGAELGLVCAFDPLHQTRPPGSIVYAQLTAMGVQTGFSDATLTDVLAKVSEQPYDDAFVTFDAPRSFQHAVRLQQIDQGDIGF